MPKTKKAGAVVNGVALPQTWPEAKVLILALLRQFGTRKIKLPFFNWTIKFSVLADQIEQFT